MTEKELAKAQGKFLLDTIKYYIVDTNRRCKGSGYCLYSPKNADKIGVSEGCAIGRHMTKYAQYTADNLLSTGIEDVIKHRPRLVPKALRELGSLFLGHMQSFHDTEINWDLEKGKGLTKNGVQKLKGIISSYNLNEKSFEKYLTTK